MGEAYYREPPEYPRLTADEECSLGRLSRAGDRAAREQLILANLPLVVSLARHYRARGVPLVDLIGEGNLGLIEGVDRFRPERGIRLSTVAHLWIRRAILTALAHQQWWAMPVAVADALGRYRATAARLRGELGREPTFEEVVDRGDLRLTRLQAGRLRAALAVPPIRATGMSDELLHRYGLAIEACCPRAPVDLRGRHDRAH